MTKNIFLDVLPPEKKSIRQISLSDLRKPKDEKVDQIAKFREDHSKRLEEDGKEKRISKKILFGAAGIILVVFFLLISTLFAGAQIKITPKHTIATIEGNFLAKRQAPESELQYEVITLKREGEKSVTATGEKSVEEKAFGEIIIYNNFSFSSQRLIKNTRFESPDGLIFKINDSIDVPGKATVDGKTIPGSLRVVVYAESAGQEYNIPPTRFTIPGFKGKPQFSAFSAESLDAFSGGNIGKVKIASEADLVKAREGIRNTLQEEILRDAYTQVPEGFVLLKNAYFVEVKELPQVMGNDSVIVKQQGILSGIIFKKDTLSKQIAKTALNNFDGNPVEIENFDEISFSLKDRTKNVQTVIDKESFQFNLSGDPKIIWISDSEKIREDFAGQARKNINDIMARHAGIEKAEVILRPFWARKFPKNIDKIKVERVD